MNAKPWLHSASYVPRFLTPASYNVSVPAYIDEKLDKLLQIAVKNGGAISGFERICIRVRQSRPSS